MSQDEDDVEEFSLVRGDVVFRLLRTVGLIPVRGLGTVRRTLLAVLLTWVPLVTAAALANRLWPGVVDEPLLQHYGVHVRFLLAVPLLIVDDAVAHAALRGLMPYFVKSGLVTEAERPRFTAILRRTRAWRDGWRPWVAIAALVAVWALTSPTALYTHELAWAAPAPAQPALRFGVFWYHYVAQPVFLVLILVWLWRLVLATALMWQISRLNLALVPTHPDGAAGLGFLEVVPLAFVAPAFAITAVLSGRWTHDVVYHQVTLKSLMIPMGSFVVILLLALMVPLLVFARTLWDVRRQSLFDYGALVGEHHRRLQRRWILGEKLQDDAMLESPELGPAAYSGRLYEAVCSVLPVPVSKRTLLAIVLLTVLPVLPLVAAEVHLGDALKKVLQTLF
jgi:hypothetical protein